MEGTLKAMSVSHLKVNKMFSQFIAPGRESYSLPLFQAVCQSLKFFPFSMG